MNVLFLDYDGVVNTPMWQLSSKGEMRCSYNFPRDNKVNNFQACQWVSEFCEKHNYCIVVTSTWRLNDNYIDCLKNGGLRNCVNVIGRTPYIPNGNKREAEIREYLNSHQDIENYIIIDDENDIIGGLKNHLISCDPNVGFGMTKFFETERLHEKINNEVVFSGKI